MASDIQVTSLSAVGGVGQIAVTVLAVPPLGMTCLSYMQPVAVKIYSATTNNSSAASHIGTVNSGAGVLLHDGLGDAVQTRYYWAAALDSEGNEGVRYPSGGGVPATTKSTVPPDGSITAAKLAPNAVTKEKFFTGLTPVEVLPSLPASGNFAGRMVFLTTNGKLYRHTGSPANAAGFTAAVPAMDITGQITHEQIVTPSLAALSANLGTVTAGILTADVSYLGAVSAGQISATQLSAISANLGTITAGAVTGITFTGGILRTAASGRRIEILGSDNRLTVYNSSGLPVAWIGDLGFGTGGIRGIGSEAEPRAATFNSSTSAGANNPTVFISRLGSANAPALDVTANGMGGNGHAIRTFNNNGGSAAIAVSAASGGYAVLAVSGNYGPFTGAHDAFLAKDAQVQIGDIVCDVRVLSRNGISDTVTEVEITDRVAARNVAGVISARVPFEADAIMAALPPMQDGEVSWLRRWLAERFDRLTINGVGEGQVNVCGRNGDIEAGDYICTSSMPGKGQRQDDDLKRSCTVARAREAITFDYPDQIKRVSCFYECG